MSRQFRLVGVLLLAFTPWITGCAAQTTLTTPPPTTAATAFFAAPPDSGAALPPQGIYPQGRRLAFMGYSGQPQRDLANGFSIAGPVYGNQDPYVEDCIAHHWPVVVHVNPLLGTPGFNDKVKRPVYQAEQVTTAAAKIVDHWAAHPEVTWWAIAPEELRPWRKDEMAYLHLVSQAIRDHDPAHRPIYIYNPNNRAADTLAVIARDVDILGKGMYVNSAGKKLDRAWVRWSVEQELAAAATAGHPVTAIVMPELCADPLPAEDTLIESWVRHDVYLGLCSGGQGVLLWSLFPRSAVHRTWQIWYNAYARCGRELTAPHGLGDVFLFGAPRHDLLVEPAAGPTVTAVPLGGNAEPNTTSEKERQARKVELPGFTVCERAFGPRRYLFIVNSTPNPRLFHIGGWPAAAHATDAFTAAPLALPPHSPLELSLPPWGVIGLVFAP